MSIHYRSDIQVLRAVAVLVVFAAHAGWVGFAGGYVGVDVFFVISGYVISRLLLVEYDATGDIRLARFYSRRLQRLLPALLCMLLACSLAAMLLLTPAEQVNQYDAAVAAAFWISNFHFLFSDVNYFTQLATENLYLHTWSLGVEEQFYLLWPLLLLLGLLAVAALRKPARDFGKYLLLVGVASLVASLYLSTTAPSYAFYLMPSRAWQFALGGLIAWSHMHNRLTISKRFPWLLDGMSVLGLGLIMLACLWFDDTTPYPGWRALVPSGGAALILAAWQQDQSSFLARSSYLAPFNWIGDISYSFYLWHWPILVVFDLLSPFLQWLNSLVALGLTFVFASLSYYCLENPIRHNRAMSRHSYVVIGASVMLILVFFAASLQLATTSFNQTRNPNQLRWQSERESLPEIYGLGCDDWNNSARVFPCVSGPPDAPKLAVMIGDSVLAQWYPALQPYFMAQGWRLVVLTKSACPMVNHSFFYDRIGGTYTVCDEWRELALQEITDMGPDMVIMGSSVDYPFSDEQWRSGTRDVIDTLLPAAKAIKLLAGNPPLPFDGPNCMARMDWLSRILENIDRDGCTVTLSPDPGWLWLEAVAAEYPQVSFINPAALACPDGLCAVLQDDLLVYRDSQHLTVEFVRSVAPELMEQILR